MDPPALSPPTAPLRSAGLWQLAFLSLFVTAVVEGTSAVALAYSRSLSRALGSDEAMISMAAAFLCIGALLAAITPMVLAHDHRVFRGALVTVHVVGMWAIQIVGYAAMLRLNAEVMAELANGMLLPILGIVAGLWVALGLFAILWGWRLTRHPERAQRPTLRVRGMLIATAAAALLFASPRILTPWVTSLVRFLHDYWVEEDFGAGATLTIESSGPQEMLLLMPLVMGFLLAIPLAAGIWVGRCRWAWLGVVLGPLVLTSLMLVGEMLSSPMAASLSVPVAVFVSLVGASLLATLQIALWQRCGWQLVRIRRGPAPKRSNDATATVISGTCAAVE